MADFVVTNNADSGPGSLRSALMGASLLGGTPTIEVHAGTGKLEIACASPLPIMTQPFRLDCLTQEGANDDRPMVYLDFSPMAAPTSGDPVYGYGGLQLSGGGQVIKGLGTKNSKVSGILVNGAADVVLVCMSGGLGLDGNALGDVLTLGNLQPGLTILNSKNIKVGGRKPRTDCVFSGSGTCHVNPADGTLVADIQQPGLMCSSSDGLTIFRSRFGMNWAGTAAVRNTFDGCKIDRTKNVLIGGRIPGGGADPAVRCSFGGNLFYGLEISHFLSNGARVIGCEFGFGADGQLALPNQRSNVIFFNTGEWFLEWCISGWCIRNGANGDGSTPGNPALPTSDDTSKGWTRRGRIRKCWFGVCRDGVTAAQNKLSNILLTQCQEILIEESVLCFGGQDAILIEGRTTPDYQSYLPVVPRYNVIRGCLIGVLPDGVTQAGHVRHGVFGNAAGYTRIGDASLPNGVNTIKYNLGTSITCRKYNFDTNIIDPNGNIISGNGTDAPLIAF